MKPILVYLAGGMKSGWQDKVIESCYDLVIGGIVEFFDPRKNPKDPEKYRANDKKNWEKADIVFGYAESSNPALFAMCIELTGGFYNNAWTIFVDDLQPEKMETPEKTEEEKKRKRYLSFIETVSHKKASGLSEGISILKDAINERIIYNYRKS
ncbi:MAG: hypothetical protein M1155_01210 [Patescibacteria group bacterium]|nr:hypothetical protein [Patescibacteria group bacterium]